MSAKNGNGGKHAARMKSDVPAIDQGADPASANAFEASASPRAASRATHYLRALHIDAYGAFSQRDIGPFTPGLNVVFGPNEAGKTTVNTFVSGVLFGWKDARSQRNTYKPANAERSGTLVFAPLAHGAAEVRCTRARNIDGITPDAEPPILDDIDEDTFATIFALTSDELRSLGKTSDVTARLLTAGAGTAQSPAQALSQVEAKLAECLSHAEKFPESIPNLQAQMDDVRAQLAQAAAEAEQFKRENREFQDLMPRRVALAQALDALNTEVQTLSVQRDALAKLNEQRERLQQQDEQLQEQEADLRAQQQAFRAGNRAKYLNLDAVEERTLREGIEDLAEKRTSLDHAVLIAKQDYASSKAHYEALEEADDIQDMRRTVKHQRRVQVLLSVVLPVLFAGLGVPVFVHGREISSLSVTALGVMLVASALFMACAALVMLFRPNKLEAEMRKRLQDAQWVMLQDKKKLEATQADLEAHDAAIEAYLDKAGLEAASGSLRRARALLDEAREMRADESLLGQRGQSLIARRAALDDAFAHNDRDRAAALDALGEADEVPLSVIDARLDQKVEQRNAQMRTSESVNARYGELNHELSQARHMRRFDELKLQDQVLKTRMSEALEGYARLLLAKRMMSAAIAAWESKSQPRVYQQASRLLSLMTEGRWTRVRIGHEGALEVLDAFDTVRDPMVLSMGTCQQLYLSLRIALLTCAENVGRSMPILADDILVNFDAKRRRGAALALGELAQMRQVIVFTCHEEVVRLMQEACEEVNLVQL